MQLASLLSACQQAKDPASEAVLCPMELQDPAAEAVRQNISDILDSNLAGPSALLTAFEEVQKALDAASGSPEQLDAWLLGEHSLQEAEAAIESLLQVSLWAVNRTAKLGMLV